MAIPESQLVVWSKVGSDTRASEAYQSVKRALRSAENIEHEHSIFLQGSYANNTNIQRKESDVDVVVRMDPGFRDAPFLDVVDEYRKFRGSVIAALRRHFGGNVKDGNKAIKIPGNKKRCNADVVVVRQFMPGMGFGFHLQHLIFHNPIYSGHTEGICLFDASGGLHVSFPDPHRKNCAKKHRATGESFKRVVRIFKNMKAHLEGEGAIGKNVAPSYFIEGLLYNAPDDLFSADFGESCEDILDYLLTAHRFNFVCVNGQRRLFGDDSNAWSGAKCAQFLSALEKLWRNW